MTNEEAIKAMTKYMPKDNDSASLVLREAMNMGIKALEQIPDLKDAYDKGYKDGQEALAFHLELCKEEGSIITVPDGATNGDMIKAVFSDDLWLQLYARRAKKEWWNSPYRKEQEWKMKE